MSMLDNKRYIFKRDVFQHVHMFEDVYRHYHYIVISCDSERVYEAKD